MTLALNTVLVTTSPCGLLSLRAVWDKLCLESGPKLCSADVTGQISVTPVNVFKLLPSGCRRHWEVLEMIALTVSDANHSWKGDSTFGCYLLGERKKNTYKFNFGAFWSLIHTWCGKRVSQKSHSDRRNIPWRSSHAIAPSTLWWFCTFSVPGYSLTNYPFIKSSGRNNSALLPSSSYARKCWIFEATPGCVLCRQHLTGLKWSQGRYESRHCLSKPGNNQPPHPPQGPSWKSLAQNNVLLLLLVWKK